LDRTRKTVTPKQDQVFLAVVKPEAEPEDEILNIPVVHWRSGPGASTDSKIAALPILQTWGFRNKQLQCTVSSRVIAQTFAVVDRHRML
jgi:hypothetical protein